MMDKKIKVLFQSRVELFEKRGGDTYHMEHTKNAIEKLDSRFVIDIKPEVKVDNIQEYDIVNLFNLDWIPETYQQALYAKQSNRKLVLSAIHHSKSEVESFEKNCRYGLRRLFNVLISSQEARDILKNIYRSFLFPKKLSSTLSQIAEGMTNQQQKLLKMMDVILVQTNIEAKEIEKDFGVKNLHFKKIVSGVNSDTFINADSQKFIDYFSKEHSVVLNKDKIVLNVGRIEPRKNQLALLEVFDNLVSSGVLKDWTIIFIGERNDYHKEYNSKFESAVNKVSNAFYLGKLPQELVASAMAVGGIYVQPSWFETLGLTSLEAALSGMKVVATGDRIKEYLGDLALYCDPNDKKSIADAIENSIEMPKPSQQKIQELISKYTWEETAKQTISVYLELLK